MLPVLLLSSASASTTVFTTSTTSSASASASTSAASAAAPRCLQVLLNSRASASLEDNYKLESMLSRNGVLKTTSNETFLNDLTTTHQWFDRWGGGHGGRAGRVCCGRTEGTGKACTCVCLKGRGRE